MNKKNIMFLGTASSVGKSTLVAALCRVLKNEDFKVSPFKAMNISLNSYVTKDGAEMGRAQVVQAEASKIEPSALMNPILLKPSGGHTQVIVNGKVYDNIEPYEYKELNKKLKGIVKESYDRISNEYDLIVLEGSGGCAEINLKDTDIANMNMAECVDAPVILVADIDRGGVFASIVGTLNLLSENERKRVKGVIINKFRGKKEYFEPGVKQLEDIIKIPVLGVMPYEYFDIDDEDSVTEKISNKESTEAKNIDIAIIRLSHMSNFTDFNVLNRINGVNIRYVESTKYLKNPDVIIIPGTKNTIEDLRILKESKLANEIIKLHESGTLVFGICGGYQMLGKLLLDQQGVEGSTFQEEGLGLLDIKTRFNERKVTKQVEAQVVSNLKHINEIENKSLVGYEIHNGISKVGKNVKPFIKDSKGKIIGVCDMEGSVAGTYLHGIFDSEEFTNAFINALKKNNDFELLENDELDKVSDYKNEQYEKLAKVFSDNIDVSKIKEIMGI
ncbi:cobyric acid synthase [Clostridium botulinum]|uniref:cobyric acid synthase n=1 Tax=Clostridium botulinum TaxID=1491 RepID=UPI00077413C0|nr:cobyric acid synthase [Clostridium botulinum]NFH80030.1 cobyric acid synthase [Clostridium botulinum]NFH82077.1 cobyric acid synthase [Clostridium botulinum]NFI10051.1 cobyric acid synthase [Clostridium botulinum]NFI15212.1 cobyric acid synthase [Clostridium botulinum]NFO85600.1 cobyric acid synthase [Clostridium botulinum]